jgi:glucoamylase
MFRFAILLSVLTAVAATGSCSVSDYDKVDCGYYGIDQTTCEAKSCCWAPSSVSGIPYCFSQAGASSSCYGKQSTMQEPFSSSEMSTMRKYFLANINIQGNGGIVAAPDYDTPGGSYYYHWMRDGALTMRCLQDTNPGNFTDIEGIVKSYSQWVLHNQNEADPNGIDVRTEPKFMLPNGEVFSSAWCRPQNDGPGLRATALIIAADSLIANGEIDYVKQYLWTGDSSKYHGGAIKYDLDYVVDNYMTNTCDLWEEIRDPDFFWNRITMKKAMIVGEAFATQMGDSASASKYRSTMLAINSTIHSSHFNGAFLQECNSRTRDSAVIVGLNDGFDTSDMMYAPTSLEVAMTVSSYNTMFCNEYSINTKDTSAGLPGVLYGRYQGDNYAGGNPWVLSTAALASLFYRGASHILSYGVPSSDVLAVWQKAFNSDTALPTDKSSLAKVFAAQGDGVLLRLRSHLVARGFHCDEQIDRNTGVQASAEDLTWSYAEILNAMYYRGKYLTSA